MKRFTLTIITFVALCAGTSGADSPPTAPLASSLVTAATAVETTTDDAADDDACCSAKKTCAMLYWHAAHGATKGTAYCWPTTRRVAEKAVTALVRPAVLSNHTTGGCEPVHDGVGRALADADPEAGGLRVGVADAATERLGDTDAATELLTEDDAATEPLGDEDGVVE